MPASTHLWRCPNLVKETREIQGTQLEDLQGYPTNSGLAAKGADRVASQNSGRKNPYTIAEFRRPF